MHDDYSASSNKLVQLKTICTSFYKGILYLLLHTGRVQHSFFKWRKDFKKSFGRQMSLLILFLFIHLVEYEWVPYIFSLIGIC